MEEPNEVKKEEVNDFPYHRWTRRMQLLEIVPLNGLSLRFSGSADKQQLALFRFDPTKASAKARITPKFTHKGITFVIDGQQKLDSGEIVLGYKITELRGSRKWK